MSSKVLNLPAIRQKPGFRNYWYGLPASARALALAELMQTESRPLVLITADVASLWQLEQEIRYFLGPDSPLPVQVLPDWETLPYDNFSPHQDIISQRLAALYQVPRMERGILLVAASTALLRLPPREYIEQNSLVLNTGQSLDLLAMRNMLEAGGYRHVSQVYEHGEYAQRGALLDVFPMGSEAPLRIDFFDDEIDSLRRFDPETQLSEDRLASINLLPAHEFPMDEAAVARFRSQWRASFDSDLANCQVYQDVSEGLTPPGIEYWLPLFFTETATLFDYLPDNSLVIFNEGVSDAFTRFSDEVAARYESRRHDRQRPILPPDSLFVPVDEFNQRINRRESVLLAGLDGTGQGHDFSGKPLPPLAIDHKLANPAARLQDYLDHYDGKLLLCAESAGRREALKDLLARQDSRLKPVASWQEFTRSGERACLTIAPVSTGFALREPALAVITETELFGEQVRQVRRREEPGINAEDLIRNLAELNIDDPVVHIEQGVGRYRGLEKIVTGDLAAEYMVLEYQGGDKLYVPVHALHQISRYSGAPPEIAPWHKLGSEQWQKARRKAQEKVRDVAAELLDVYARRAAHPGVAFEVEPGDYEKFIADFPFETTDDQENAIQAVITDLRSDQPMDRLVCGDVGFGKTEVALRAAFIAAQSGKQVALLVPTTLLAEQHYETFSDRFADWPMQIESLSRFRTGKEQKQVLEGLASGRVDIVIGTHKLIQSDVKFRQLGLVIIDEEHRFGVRQKEQLKALRAEVDVLTLTATPIPRTLNMSMSGMRELSIIATPPARRLSVKTFVREFNRPLIREAILRETLRGGQVYFLHNQVDSIERIAGELRELVPEARILVAHGQMRERELEQAMRDFYHQRYNVLLCTTIIETGIDIPNANTIIINRADRFGLAQLHQLRGRVGRSHHQAYAYLLTPEHRSVTADARKRLDAIASLEDLGAGFTLATHDLEIRGAGELLGDEQSGQIQSVGFSLYMEMLENAVTALKEGREPSLQLSLARQTEIDLGFPALIPDDYVPDISMRLSLYKRIAGAGSEHELDRLKVEFIDRFGLLPEALKNLFLVTELKIRATPLAVAKIDRVHSGLRFRFQQETPVDPATIISLIQRQPWRYKLSGANEIRITLDDEVAVETLLTESENLIAALTPAR